MPKANRPPTKEPTKRQAAALAGALLLLASALPARQTAAQEVETAPVVGRVLSAAGTPVAGVRVVGRGYRLELQATTDAEGRFSLDVPVKPRDQRRGMTLLATADADRLAYRQLGYDVKKLSAGEPVELKLGPTKKLTATVVDGEGQPIAGARVGVQAGFRCLVEASTDAGGSATLLMPHDARPQAVFGEKPGAGFDYRVVSTRRQQNFAPEWFDKGEVALRLADAGPVTLHVADRAGKPVANMPLHVWLINKPDEPDSFNNGGASEVLAATTNDRGVAVFTALPKWNKHPFTLWPTSDPDRRVRNEQEFIHRRVRVPKSHVGGEPLAVTVERPVPVRGRAIDPEGRPVAGVQVNGSGYGYQDDHFRGGATTDDQGSFELLAYPDELLMLIAGNQEWAAPAIDGLITKPGEPIEGLEFQLRPATRVFGRLTVVDPDDGSDQPVAGKYVRLSQQGRSLRDIDGELPKPAEASRRNVWIGSSYWRNAQTDDDGRFEFFVGPGEYTLRGTSQAESFSFTVTDQTEVEHDLRGKRPESGVATIRVVAGEPPKPVAGARVTGIYRSRRSNRFFQPGETNDQGEFRAERQLHLLALEATGPNKTGPAKKLRGAAELAAEADEITISLFPTATATGRLVDPLFGEPMAGEVVQYGTRVYIGPDEDSAWQTAWGGDATTDAQGRFTAENLIPGREYQLSLTNRHADGSTRSWSNLTTLTPKPDGEIDLGDISRTKRGPLAKLIKQELRPKRPATDLYLRALESYHVKERDWPLVTVFVDDDEASAAAWFRLQLVTPATRDRLAGCEVLLVGTQSNGAFALAETLGVRLFTSPRPIVVLRHPRGVHAALTGDRLTDDDGALDAQRLADFLDEHLKELYGT